MEQLDTWAASLHRLLNGIRSAKVFHAPIRDYGEYEWFTVPDGLPSGFSLVVCDGPWSSVKGGRSGVLPTMGRRMAPNVVFLMDDANRQGELDIMKTWERDYGAETSVVPAEGRPYGLVTFPKGTVGPR